MKLYLRATGCHLTHGITYCYLPPNTSEHTLLEPQPEADTRFSYPGGMECQNAIRSSRTQEAALKDLSLTSLQHPDLPPNPREHTLLEAILDEVKL